MRKKVISIFLASAMVAGMLTGCSSKTTKVGTEQSSSTGEGGEPYTVAIQVVNITSDQTDVEKVEKAINEITVPAINCKVDIQNTLIGDLATQTSMNVVSGEKMDIVCAGFTQKVTDIAGDGILMPLDDYLKYAPTLVDQVSDYMEVGKVDGVQYAIPSNGYAAVGKGFVYNKDMADKYGIVLKDGVTYDELSDAFEILAKDGVYGTSNGPGESFNAQFFYNLELYGTNGDYGMIFDPVNSTTIENVFASDMFKEYCKQMKAWVDKGYMPADALTNTTSPQEYFAMQKLFGMTTNLSMSEYATWQSGMPFNVDIVEVQEPVVTTNSIMQQMWGLASTCENPKKSMEFLNYMYENPDVANLLQYGVEGQNYVKVNGTKKVITVDGSKTGREGYVSLFTHFGNPIDTLTAVPNTDSYGDDVIAFNERAKYSKALGYAFNISDFSSEAGAVSNIIAEYMPRLQTGQVDDIDAYINKFVGELDNAGYNDIIAGNQAQLDAFLKSK